MKISWRRFLRQISRKCILPDPRAELLSRESMIWQCVFPSAAIRFREMRSSVLLREEEVCLSTGQTVINLSAAERSRLITAEWEDPGDTEEGGQYLAELKLYADDRRGLLLDITKVFTEEKIDVKSMNTRTSKKGTATMDMGFIVHGREELNRVIKKLRQIENVIDIERTTG